MVNNSVIHNLLFYLFILFVFYLFFVPVLRKGTITLNIYLSIKTKKKKKKSVILTPLWYRCYDINWIRKFLFPWLSPDHIFFFNVRKISSNVSVRVLDCGLLYLAVTQLPNQDPKFTPPHTTNMKYDAGNFCLLYLFRQKPNEHFTSFLWNADEIVASHFILTFC